LLALISCQSESQEYRLVPFEYQQRYGFFDEDSGRVIIEPRFARVFPRDPAGVVYGRVSDSEWELIGLNGERLASLDYATVIPLIAGLYDAIGGDGADPDASFGVQLLNYDGDVVIAPDNVGQGWDGVVAVQFWNQGWTLVDANGDEVFDDKYFYSIEPFSEGYALVQYTPREFGFVDGDGEPVLRTDELLINGSLSEGLAFASRPREKRGYIDITGEFQIVVPGMRTGSDFYSGRAAIEMEDGSFRIIDNTGETVHQFGAEVTFIAVQGFQSGHLLITRGGPGSREYAFVDPDGKQLGPSFLDAENFHYGWARVRTAGGPGVFSADGELILSSELMKGR